MKMWRLEKLMVNRSAKGRWNVARVAERIEALGLDGVRDVLELGCGRGDVAAFLAKRYGLKVTGADLDPAQVELARRKHPETGTLRFAVEDAAGLSLPAGSVDLVLAQHVFHHVPDWPAIVRETARVLRPGGQVLWFDLAAPPRLKRWLRPFTKRAGLYTLEEVLSAFASAGILARSCRKVRMGPLTHHDLWLRRA